MLVYRYGTLSSLERFPSDETDDGDVKLTPQEPESNTFNAGNYFALIIMAV